MSPYALGLLGVGALFASRPLCHASRFTGAAMIGAGLLLVATPALARDETLLAKDNSEVACTVSRAGLTRISLKDDRFASLSKLTREADVNDFSVVHEPTRGDIYISLPDGYVRPDVSFFGTSAKGFVYKFACRVAGETAHQVFVENRDLLADAPGAVARPGRGDASVALVQAMYASRPLDGFELRQPDLAAVRVGDLTWHALMSKSATKPSVEYAEFLMSMVGTVIYVRSDDDGAKLGEFRFIAPASWDTYTALLDGTAAAPTKILRCDTTEELGCLNPTTQTLSISENASFRSRIRKMMASMAAKVRSNAALTGEEISLLGMSSIPLYKILVVNEAAAFRLADSDMNGLAEIVAIDVLVAQIDRMLDEVARAQAGTQFVSTEEFRAWRDQVATVKTELGRKSTAMANNLSNTYRIIERTQMLEATLKNAMSPQLSASLRFGRGLSAQGLR